MEHIFDTEIVCLLAFSARFGETDGIQYRTLACLHLCLYKLFTKD